MPSHRTARPRRAAACHNCQDRRGTGTAVAVGGWHGGAGGGRRCGACSEGAASGRCRGAGRTVGAAAARGCAAVVNTQTRLYVAGVVVAGALLAPATVLLA